MRLTLDLLRAGERDTAIRSADPAVASQPQTGAFVVASPVEPVVFVAKGGTNVVDHDVNWALRCGPSPEWPRPPGPWR